jgi:segregation and condensation protein A
VALEFAPPKERPDIGTLLASDIETEDLIEKLAGLATTGDLNPWDVDIVSIYDRFMDAMTEKKRLNLRISGRSIYYAAVLLRLKAEALNFYEEPEPPPPEWNGYAHLVEPPDLPRVRFIRRAPRPVVLDELANALREAETLYRRRLERQIQRSVSPEEVLKFHEEDIEDRIRIVSGLLEKLFGKHKTVCLDDLLDTLGRDKRTVVFTFMALLFLATRGMVAAAGPAPQPPGSSLRDAPADEEDPRPANTVAITLTQEEFFGTLLVNPR